MADGWSEPKAIGFIQTICDEVKGQVERETCVNYEEFTAVEYRSEFVEREVNYLIKVYVGGAYYDHLLVSEENIYPAVRVGFPKPPPKLLGVQQHKTKEDPLEPFPPNVVATGAPAPEWSGTEDATEETQKICHQLKDQVERETGVNYQEFTAVEYRCQDLLGGVNYLIKVRVGGTDYDHLSVFRALPCNGGQVELRGVEQHKTREDPLEPFPPNVGTVDATEEIQKICDEVKDQVEREINDKYWKFTAVEYRSQLVARENFLIKVHVGGADYIHLSVFRALPCNGGQVELLGVLQDKTREDPLEHFTPNLVTGADIILGGWSGTKVATEEIQKICDEVKDEVKRQTYHSVNYEKFTVVDSRRWSGTMFGTEETQEICDEVKDEAEQQTYRSVEEFTAVEYRIQLMDGENFLIKVRVRGADYIHLSVFRAYPCDGRKVRLLGVLEHKTREDPLELFPPNVRVVHVCGGLSGTTVATKRIQEICDEVKDQVEKKTGVNYKEFTALAYRNAIVGAEYFLIKVYVGGADYVHLNGFKVQHAKLEGVEQHKTRVDPLKSFTN